MIKKLIKYLNLKAFRSVLAEIVATKTNTAIVFQKDILWFAVHDKIIMSRPEYSFFKNLLRDLDIYVIEFIERTGDSLAIDSLAERARDEYRNNQKKEKKRTSQLVFFGTYINQDMNIIRINKLANDEEVAEVIIKNIQKYVRVI